MATSEFLFIFVLFSSAFGVEEEIKNEPVYKYRFQTDEMMKTSASELPVHGYHVAEGRYFPERYRGGFDKFDDFDRFGRNFGYHSRPGFSNSYNQAPYFDGGFGSRFYHGPTGGGYADRKYYNDENKKIQGEGIEKAQGSKAVSAGHGSEGFSKGEIAHKDEKGENGFYKDAEGQKKSHDDEKSYEGGQHFNKNGEKGETQKAKQSHRKGHVTKGFKTSHHKDENGKTETFYDEANDEGDNYNYGGQQGTFGAKEQSSFKGGHENGQFAVDEKRKQGHFDNHHVVDKANADKGQYDERGYHGTGQAYNYNNGVGQHSLLGKQEANREFYHQHPYGHRPFYTGY